MLATRRASCVGIIASEYAHKDGDVVDNVRVGKAFAASLNLSNYGELVRFSAPREILERTPHAAGRRAGRYSRRTTGTPGTAQPLASAVGPQGGRCSAAVSA